MLSGDGSVPCFICCCKNHHIVGRLLLEPRPSSRRNVRHGVFCSVKGSLLSRPFSLTVSVEKGLDGRLPSTKKLVDMMCGTSVFSCTSSFWKYCRAVLIGESKFFSRFSRSITGIPFQKDGSIHTTLKSSSYDTTRKSRI